MNKTHEVKKMVLPMLLASSNVSFPGLGINDLPINRVAFQIGSFPIYWYGICIILAFGACVGLAMKQANKFYLTSDHVIDFCLAIIPASVIGARLYYVAFSWKTFSEDLKSIFDIRNGGLAVLGGVLASFLAVFIMIKIKKMRPSIVFDFLIVYIPLGQAIGRWGNFFNQEAFGTNTDLPWGMISESTSAYIRAYYPTLNPDLPVHPTFLYESLACILIFVILLLIRKKSRQPYSTVAAYFILYGIVRFFIEGLRTDSLYIADTGLRSSQVLSAVLVVVGFAIIAVCRYLGLERAVVAAVPSEELTKEISSADAAAEAPMAEDDKEDKVKVEEVKEAKEKEEEVIVKEESASEESASEESASRETEAEDLGELNKK